MMQTTESVDVKDTSPIPTIVAYPIRVIPFDLGRQLSNQDIADIRAYAVLHHQIKQLTPRQSSILKDFSLAFTINSNVELYLYNHGICVVVISDPFIELTNQYRDFSIAYGENRKTAHSELSAWTHPESEVMDSVITALRTIVYRNTKKPQKLRKSASKDFENQGLSYIMTLSMFDIDSSIIAGKSFKDYPGWLKSNLYALLEPSVLYLEDSSKFGTVNESDYDMSSLLQGLENGADSFDYERHRHVSTFMSWSAVVLVGKIQKTDREEYISLEVQLQCDWFYIYCLDKNLETSAMNKRKIIDLQRQGYELELLENRLYDFDDTSMPTRVLDIQKGLVETSGLENNIEHLQRKIRYYLEREQLETEVRQKKLGQSSEILLFIIAFIEIAPVVAEYGNMLFPHAGAIANCLIIIFGLILLIRKN